MTNTFNMQRCIVAFYHVTVPPSQKWPLPSLSWKNLTVNSFVYSCVKQSELPLFWDDGLRLPLSMWRVQSTWASNTVYDVTDIPGPHTFTTRRTNSNVVHVSNETQTSLGLNIHIVHQVYTPMTTLDPNNPKLKLLILNCPCPNINW